MPKLKDAEKLLSLQKKADTKAPKPAAKAPEPAATGDDRIAIIKHGIYKKDKEPLGIEFVVKNVSKEDVGLALFETVLYGKKGNIIDTLQYKTTGLKPQMNKTIRITSSKPECSTLKSYSIKLVKTTLTPIPTATDNDKLAILSHSLYETDMRLRGPMGSDGAQLVIKNVSGKTIATGVFDTTFYDVEGNIVYSFEHKETNIKPDNSRSFIIYPPETTRNKIKSYKIELIRVTTADFEKVQIRRHDVRTNDAGEEEVVGTVKNLTETKTDAVLVANFYDEKKGVIGTKVVIVKDIEPDGVRKFHFIFKPQEGDKIRSYNLRVACDIEECQEDVTESRPPCRIRLKEI